MKLFCMVLIFLISSCIPVTQFKFSARGASVLESIYNSNDRYIYDIQYKSYNNLIQDKKFRWNYIPAGGVLYFNLLDKKDKDINIPLYIIIYNNNDIIEEFYINKNQLLKSDNMNYAYMILLRKPIDRGILRFTILSGELLQRTELFLVYNGKYYMLSR